MKTVSASLENAILNTGSVSMLVKAIIDPSRTYFDTLTYDDPYDASDYSVPTDTPVGQCMIYSAYMEKAYTFIVDSSTGGLYAMEQDAATKHDLSITANLHTKPSAIDLGNGSALLYYWNNSPSELHVVTVNLTTFGTSSDSSITIDSLPSRWSITAGSPTAIDQNHLILCYQTSLGGIGVAIKDGTSWYHWNQRFMSAKVETDLVWTIYTSATIFNGYVYVYATDIDGGDVRAVQYNPYRNVWSDIFVALSSDLSRFDIGNAIVANGYVHIAGQFHRTDDLANAQVYSLVLRSSDGKNFSWDRFTLLANYDSTSSANIGFQYQIAMDNTNKKLYASDRNSIGIADASYFFTAVPTGRVTLVPPASVVSFASNGQSAKLVLPSANEVYIDNATIRKGSRVIVYVGYKTSTYATGEYVKYAT